MALQKAVIYFQLKTDFIEVFYKIALPSDAKAIADKLRIVPGFDRVEENMIEK